MKEKAIIYGAGGNTRKLLSMIDSSFSYVINCIVDREKTLQGTEIHGIKVKSLEEIGKLDYDRIIISLDVWSTVADWLQSEYQIREDRILVLFILDTYQILTTNDMRILEEREKQAVAIELLDELVESEELEGYESIDLIGSANELCIVDQFVDARALKLRVIKNSKNREKNCKYLFLGEDYKQKMQEYRNKGIINDYNWNFVPLYDLGNG